MVNSPLPPVTAVEWLSTRMLRSVSRLRTRTEAPAIARDIEGYGHYAATDEDPTGFEVAEMA